MKNYSQLSKQEVEASNEIVKGAANGHTDCLKILLQTGGVATDEAVEYAAANGHTDCLKLLLNNGGVATEYAVICAADNGHTECLKLLKKYKNNNE